MKKILTVPELSAQLELLNQPQITLVGGCFDILHLGHVTFLEEAKQPGDFLVVLLESDDKIKQTKGEQRPFHPQSTRAKILSALAVVDLVVLLPNLTEAKEYDKIIAQLHPNVLAITKGSPNLEHYQRSAQKTGATIREVTKYIPNHSSSKIVKFLQEL